MAKTLGEPTVGHLGSAKSVQDALDPPTESTRPLFSIQWTLLQGLAAITYNYVRGVYINECIAPFSAHEYIAESNYSE